ncbi:tail fiber assembly protein [Tatumella terrea]|uniref:Tail fiber assembly protein n=1 Tax=Tatumella terrea TaxID=419007 RepID=A0ABW1VU68_9GAMM
MTPGCLLKPWRFTKVDKTSLTAWMKYIQATDLSNAPDISWPVNLPEGRTRNILASCLYKC